MAHSLSAKKRVRQNAKRRVLNRGRKSEIKTEVKKLEKLMKDGNLDQAKDQLKLVQKKVDQIASTPTMHKNTAARLKSRLTRNISQLQEANK